VRAARAALVAALVAGLCSAAHARPAHRKARPHADNMPRGFAWPPSAAMREAATACERDLDAADVHWTRAKQEGHIVSAVTIDDAALGGIAFAPVYGKRAYVMDCQLARALVQLGPTLRDLGVREVRFGSIYRWSNIRVGGKTKPILSRHALGLAMDVVSFIDADGREAVVGRDYQRGDELLLAIERAIDADARFRMVLTPKNDPISHRDHFHVEANPDYSRPPS
jgi:hypothetical protein